VAGVEPAAVGEGVPLLKLLGELEAEVFLHGFELFVEEGGGESVHPVLMWRKFINTRSIYMGANIDGAVGRDAKSSISVAHVDVMEELVGPLNLTYFMTGRPMFFS